MLSWFFRNRRDDPWREKPTPYSIWIAEVMLQQTVVKAVVPYFARWMKEFPTIARLAAAQEQKVLRAWEGLGYYSRARNLHRAAKQIVREHDGKLPAKYNELLRLPGIGEYTAAAIMSIALRQPYPVVDANVRRVVQRLLAIRTLTPKNERQMREFLELAISPNEPGEFNEAIMELGQTVCRNRQALCGECPIRRYCRAEKMGIQSEIPAQKRRATRQRASIVMVIVSRGRILLAENASGMFAGMFTLPKIVSGGSNEDAAISEHLSKLGVGRFRVIGKLRGRKHLYTKYTDRLSPVMIRLATPISVDTTKFRWVAMKDLEQFPMPAIHRKIVADINGA